MKKINEFNIYLALHEQSRKFIKLNYGSVVPKTAVNCDLILEIKLSDCQIGIGVFIDLN